MRADCASATLLVPPPVLCDSFETRSPPIFHNVISDVFSEPDLFTTRWISGSRRNIPTTASLGAAHRPRYTRRSVQIPLCTLSLPGYRARSLPNPIGTRCPLAKILFFGRRHQHCIASRLVLSCACDRPWYMISLVDPEDKSHQKYLPLLPCAGA